MASTRTEILEWAEAGHIAPQDLRRALEVGTALPTTDEWRQFLDRLLLYMGATMLAAGLIFFLAYNWRDLGRFAKFGLAEGALLAALAVVWQAGLDRAAGKAALLASALLVGALLALVGQTYQTGADTFDLFAAWAVAILPWALVSTLPALCVLWLAIVNLAVLLYFHAFPGWLGIPFGPERQLWVLFGIDIAALVAWEAAALLGLDWLRGRWAPRLIATASGAFASALAVFAILEWKPASAVNVLIWAGWLGATYAAYRYRLKDVYMLAGGTLSLIVVATAFLAKRLIVHGAGEAMGFLLVGLAIIGMSAAGAYWLRKVIAEPAR